VAVLGVAMRFLGGLWIFPSNQKNVARGYSAVYLRYSCELMEGESPVYRGLVEGGGRVIRK